MSGHDCVWRDLGVLELPDRQMFVGDPTGGHDDHLRGVATVEINMLRVWVFEAGPDRPAFEVRRTRSSGWKRGAPGRG